MTDLCVKVITCISMEKSYTNTCVDQDISSSQNVVGSERPNVNKMDSCSVIKWKLNKTNDAMI